MKQVNLGMMHCRKSQPLRPPLPPLHPDPSHALPANSRLVRRRDHTNQGTHTRTRNRHTDTPTPHKSLSPKGTHTRLTHALTFSSLSRPIFALSRLGFIARAMWYCQHTQTRSNVCISDAFKPATHRWDMWKCDQSIISISVYDHSHLYCFTITSPTQ